MKVILLVLVLLLGFTIQSSLVEKISILGFRPDLLLAIVVYIGLLRGPIPASVAGFVIGLVVDLSTTHLLGINALSMSVAGFVAGNVWVHINRESSLAQFLVLFLLSLLHDIIFLILTTGGRLADILQSLGWVSIPSGLYTSAISPVLFRIFMKLVGTKVKLEGRG
ncbi:MAG: rod shape-determining protein MreD [Candidatus Eisenbacteria bacterium]|nr:rod shape-determining protein MreD [Candidatus Eisenbacteria bacterium]